MEIVWRSERMWELAVRAVRVVYSSPLVGCYGTWVTDCTSSISAWQNWQATGHHVTMECKEFKVTWQTVREKERASNYDKVALILCDYVTHFVWHWEKNCILLLKVEQWLIFFLRGGDDLQEILRSYVCVCALNNLVYTVQYA